MDKQETMMLAAGLLAVAILAVALVYAFRKTDTESDNDLLALLGSKTYDLSAITNHDLTGMTEAYYNYLTVTDRNEQTGKKE